MSSPNTNKDYKILKVLGTSGKNIVVRDEIHRIHQFCNEGNIQSLEALEWAINYGAKVSFINEINCPKHDACNWSSDSEECPGHVIVYLNWPKLECGKFFILQYDFFLEEVIALVDKYKRKASN